MSFHHSIAIGKRGEENEENYSRFSAEKCQKLEAMDRALKEGASGELRNLSCKHRRSHPL